VTVEGIISDEL